MGGRLERRRVGDVWWQAGMNKASEQMIDENERKEKGERRGMQ